MRAGRHDHLAGLQERAGGRRAADARGVDLIEAGNPPHIPQDESQATYHSWPRPEDQRRFRQRGGRYGTVFDLMRYM